MASSAMGSAVMQRKLSAAGFGNIKQNEQQDPRRGRPGADHFFAERP